MITLTFAPATLATPSAPAIAATPARQHRVRTVAAAATHVLLLAGDADDDAGTSTWAQRSVDGGRTWNPALSPRLAGHAIVSVVAVDGYLRVLTRRQGAPAGAVFLLQSADAGAKRVWSDGTSALVFSRSEFVERLVALVPTSRAKCRWSPIT